MALSKEVKRKDFEWKKTFLIRFCTLGQSALNSLGNKQFPRGVLCNLGHCCVNCPVSVSPPKSDQNVTSQKMLDIMLSKKTEKELEQIVERFDVSVLGETFNQNM